MSDGREIFDDQSLGISFLRTLYRELSRYQFSTRRIASIIRSCCFPLTSEWQRRAVIQNDFLVRLAEIESTSRYTHISCQPASACWNSFSLSSSLHVSLHGVHKHASMHTTSNFIYIFRIWMLQQQQSQPTRSRRQMNFGSRLHHAPFLSSLLMWHYNE